LTPVIRFTGARFSDPPTTATSAATFYPPTPPPPSSYIEVTGSYTKITSQSTKQHLCTEYIYLATLSQVKGLRISQDSKHTKRLAVSRGFLSPIGPNFEVAVNVYLKELLSSHHHNRFPQSLSNQ
jgi:hypothetical protein